MVDLERFTYMSKQELRQQLDNFLSKMINLTEEETIIINFIIDLLQERAD